MDNAELYRQLSLFLSSAIHRVQDNEMPYYLLDSFLRKNLKAKRILVASLLINGKKNHYFRSHWGGEAEGLDKEKILNSLKEKVKQPFQYIFNSHECIFSLGELAEEEGQEFFLFFEYGLDYKIPNSFYRDFEETLIGLFGMSRKYISLARLKSLIHIDDVTGLYNQRKLALDLEHFVRIYNERQSPFAVLFIDIDYFKSVNDGHGHLVGTQLLAAMAHLLKKVLRESDLVYRYGGDEFVMLLPQATIHNARKLGGRILRAVKAHDFAIEGSKGLIHFKLSVSIGIASVPQDALLAGAILEMADQMMYQAKSSGRGKVCHAGVILE